MPELQQPERWKLLSRLDETLFPEISPRTQKIFKEWGVVTIRDVLSRLPRRYEDRRWFDGYDALSENRPVCLRVRVVDVGWKGSRGKGGYFEARVEDRNGLGGSFACRWFHFPGIAHMILAGQELIIYGTPKKFGRGVYMVHPDFEEVQEGSSIHMDRIVPVYGNTTGLGTRKFREIVWTIFQRLDPAPEQGIYEFSPKKSVKESLRNLHFPETMEDVRQARRRFALEECLLQQLQVGMRRMRIRSHTGLVTAGGSSLVRDLLSQLPFEMTLAQKRCLREIYQDMKLPRRMNRLLQGDVGSGKTLVALCAMLLAVESGFSAVLMAPTRILAEQHYRKFRQLLNLLEIPLSLRTGDKKEDSFMSSVAHSPSIIVGTHALLYASAELPEKTGLVIIDEQHKFGVLQRERLIAGAGQPDVLVMTATPIPRTLTLTVYGDLDVSVIDCLPAGRGKVTTILKHPRELDNIALFLQERLEAGEQAYIVSPLIEESSTRKSSAVVNELAAWQKRLPHIEIGLLHGRMLPDEKDAVMRDFLANKISVLVATSVVEVGVDVPNATVMIILSAESFGLSQLHQLRGRIGRGQRDSWCFLVSEVSRDDEQWNKLHVMESTQDGFLLAEEDLKLRGPGNVLGTEQSGHSAVQFDEWLLDTRLINRGKELAEAILKEDPALSSDKYRDLKIMLQL